VSTPGRRPAATAALLLAALSTAPHARAEVTGEAPAAGSASEPGVLDTIRHEGVEFARDTVGDAVDLLFAPLDWRGREWLTFGAVGLGTGLLFLADEPLDREIGRARVFGREGNDAIRALGTWPGLVGVTGAFALTGVALDRPKERETTRLLLESLAISQLFQAGLKVAQDASAWTIDASDGQGLTELVESKMAERNAPLEAMTLEGFDRRGAEAALEERLRGWGDESLLFDGGGLSLRYRDVTLLAEDLLVSSGPKPAVEGATPTRAPQALVLKGSAERVVVLLDLPLRQVLDVTVYFAVGEEPELLGGQRAATIIGIQNPNRPEGLGYDWGLIPVELDRRGIAKTTTVLVEENRVPPGEDLVMELSVEKQRPAVQIAGFLRPALGSDGDVQKGKPVYGERAGSRGYVAIVAEGIDLYVTGLEVRGQVDPDRLR